MAYQAQNCGSNEALIDEMIENKSISSLKIASIMKKVDRKDFVLIEDLDDAYDDRPIPIGYGATISAPHMHAYAMECLIDNLKPGNTVLDVGSGSGYLCACMAHLVISKNKNNKDSKDKDKHKDKENKDSNEFENSNNKSENNGKVIGIEHIKQLAEQSIKNLNKSKIHKQFLDSKIIEIKVGDARKEVPDLCMLQIYNIQYIYLIFYIWLLEYL